jgi:HAE1 family hydrophobic/amphiphilic exporter-1
MGSPVRTVEDLNGMILTVLPGGRPLRLEDVGEISVEEIRGEGRTLVNGAPVVVLLVRKDADANTLEVSSLVHAELAKLEEEQHTAAAVVLDDHADYIRTSVRDLEHAVVTGGLLAFIVLLGFLRNSSSPLIIGVALPVSILGAFLGMELAGMSINVVSLTGLALGIGMLGDNATIMMENVARLREGGVPALRSVLLGASGIGSAVTASTFTNVAVFLPLLLVEGVSAHLFRDVAITMTVSLLISLVVAATIVPVLLTISPARKSRVGADLAPVVRLLTRTGYRCEASGSRAILRLVGKTLDHPWVTIAGTGGVLLIMSAVAWLIPVTPVPELDQRQFSIDLLIPGGLSPGFRDSLMFTAERVVRRTEGVARILTFVGVREYDDDVTLAEDWGERVRMDVRISEGQSTTFMMEKARASLGAFVRGCDGAEMEVNRKETSLDRLLRVRGNDILVRVHGEGNDALLALVPSLVHRLAQIEGIVDIRTTLRSRVPEYRLSVAVEKAATLGVPPADVLRQILADQDSHDVGDVTLGGRRTALRLVPRWAGGVTMDDLLSSRVDHAAGTFLAGDLMEHTLTTGLRELHRANREQFLPIRLHVRNRAVAAVESAIRDTLAGMSLPAGCRVSIGGRGDEQSETNRGLVLALILALLLVYMILASEYESFFSPLVILLTSPLAATGAIAAMALTGVGYNVMSLVGLALMVGAVDNDAVIALDAILCLHRTGMPLRAAILEGLRQRLRPIVMTSVTTVAGVAPLLADFGAGSQIVRSLTIPLAGGVVASAVSTILVIPVVTLLAGRRLLMR